MLRNLAETQMSGTVRQTPTQLKHMLETGGISVRLKRAKKALHNAMKSGLSQTQRQQDSERLMSLSTSNPTFLSIANSEEEDIDVEIWTRGCRTLNLHLTAQNIEKYGGITNAGTLNLPGGC